MPTALWIVIALLAGALGYLLARGLARRWPRHRTALTVTIVIGFVAWVFVLDVEPPWEASTVRASGYALPPALEIAAWLIHYGFFGSIFGIGAAERFAPAPPPGTRKRPS